MVILNHHSIDHGDVEIHTSNYLLEYTSGSVTDPDNTSIKSINNDKMDKLLELFYLEHDDYLWN